MAPGHPSSQLAWRTFRRGTFVFSPIEIQKHSHEAGKRMPDYPVRLEGTLRIAKHASGLREGPKNGCDDDAQDGHYPEKYSEWLALHNLAFSSPHPAFEEQI